MARARQGGKAWCCSGAIPDRAADPGTQSEVTMEAAPRRSPRSQEPNRESPDRSSRRLLARRQWLGRLVASGFAALTFILAAAPVAAEETTSTCLYGLYSYGTSWTSEGGSGTTRVWTSQPDCAWTAVTNDPSWLTVTSGASGTGIDFVEFMVNPNAGLARTGTLSIAGYLYVVQQDGPTCTFQLSPTSVTAAASGATGSVAVTPTWAGCAWTAVSNAPAWLTITAGASGTGPGVVQYAVEPNSGEARTGSLTIGGKTFTVNQNHAPCTYGLSPTGATVPSIGASGTVVVTPNLASCPWVVISSEPSWLTLIFGAAGTGNGTVGYQAAANPGDTRTGTLTIGGVAFTVTQEHGTCVIGIDPAGASAGSAGGAGAFALSANFASCPWSAVSSDPSWLTITGNASGQGSAPVAYAVAPNPGEARSAIITVGGQVFTVQQAVAPCEYTLAPTGASFSPAGGDGTVLVTTNVGQCAWEAVSSDPSWLTVTSAPAGTGTGTVDYAVAANEGEARAATLTIGGRVFAVAQAAPPCSFALDPLSTSLPAEGGDGTVALTANLASCAWAATSSQPSWLAITSGASGSGGGTIAFSAAANTGEARSATLTIAGIAFAVEQAVAPCVFGVAPGHHTVPQTGGTRIVLVTSNVAACPWTAVSNDLDWLTVVAGESGEGSGTVEVSVAPGAGEARSGTLEIAGQLVSVIQVADPFALMIPAAANTEGVGNSRWQTDIDLLNTGDAEAVVELALLRANQANPAPATEQVTVPAGGTTRLTNVLGSLFSAGNAALGIKFLAGGADVNARFYNTASACGGTYGMMLPASFESAAVLDGAPVFFHLLTHSADPDTGFRVNVGFANATDVETTMAIELHAGDGTLLKTVSQTLEGFEHRQITTIFRQQPATASVAAGYAVVRSETQATMVYTYAMVIDNVSGDPVYIRPVRGVAAPVADGIDVAIAAAANAGGENGTRWQSDIDLFNSAASPASVRLSLLRANQANPAPATADVEVAPGTTVRLSNVLGSTFSASNAAIGVEMLSGWADVSSRFYNTASACGGTFGMFIPGQGDATAIASGQTGYFHHLTFSRDGTTGFRVNIGFMNDTAFPADVEIRLYGDNGELLKTVPATLQPYEHRQFTRIHREPAPVTPSVARGYATITVATPGGRVHAYAMLIDNVSGDPVFIEPTVFETVTPAAQARQPSHDAP